MLVSTWVSGLDGVPAQAQNVNQQHAASGLVALPAVVAALRGAEAGGPQVDDELLRRALVSEAAAHELVAVVGAEAVVAVLSDAHCSVMTELAADPAESLLSAHDAGRLLVALGAGRLASPEVSATVEQLLREQPERDGLPLGLPEDALVADLTGRRDDVRHDVALVRAEGRDPVVICVLTTGLELDEAEWRTSDLARFLWESLPG